jgi:YD repeat-containing protein
MPGGSAGFAITPDSKFIYIPKDRDLEVINTATNQVITNVFLLATGYVQAACSPVIPPLHADIPPPAYAADVVPIDGAGAGGSGPSAADGVRLDTGVYENAVTDVVTRNPVGPGVVFSRSYRTATAAKGYSSPGLSLGWTHNYDVTVTGISGSWGSLTLTYPNLAVETWTPVLDGNGNPTGAFTVPTGAPYIVSGTPSATIGQWNSLSVMFKDQSMWTFTPVGNKYLLTRITNLIGRYITLNYNGLELISVTDDSATPNTLLSLNYANGANYLSSLVEYSDPNNPRGITYGFGTDPHTNAYVLTSVSQIYYAGAPNSNPRWQYAYTSGVAGLPFLASVSVPDPTGGTGMQSNAIAYDPTSGKVTSLLDANLNQRSYSGGTLVTVGPQGGPATMHWTQNFQAPFLDTGTTDANSNSDHLAYADANNPFAPTTATDRNNHSVEIAYVQPNAQQPANGNVDTVTDARGVVTTSTYQYNLGNATFSLGWLQQVQTVNKTATTFAYYDGTTQVNGVTQALGLLKSVSTPQPGTSNTGAQVTTTYTYTALGNIATITVPAPNTTANSLVTYIYHYTDNGKSEALNEPTSVTDPLGAGHTTYYGWDTGGHLISVTDAQGNTTQFSYNVADQLMTVTYPKTVGPNSAYTLTHYLYPGGPVQNVQLFDESGTLIREVDRTGGKEDELTKLAGSVPTVSSIYDSLYRGSQFADGKNNLSTQSYDGVSNPTLFTWPDYLSQTFFDSQRATTFDADGNPETTFDGRNLETDLAYQDPESLLTGVSYPNQNYPGVSYIYDAYGRVQQRTDAASQEIYAYDDLDVVQSVTTTYLSSTGTALFTREVSYTYNNDGSRATMKLDNQAGNYQYTYDAAGRLSQIQFPWYVTDQNGNHNLNVVYNYLFNNWLSGQTSYYNTLDQNGKPLTVYLVYSTYVYNARGQLLTLANSTGPAGLSTFQTMKYDGAGNRLSMNVSIPIVYKQLGNFTSPYAAGLSGTVSWTYDAQDHLTQENNQLSTQSGGSTDQYAVPYVNNYVSDAAENLTTFRNATIGYNIDNQLSTVTYDGEGNPTAYPVFGSGTRTTTFDPEDRMTFLTGFFHSGYFADGRRAWRQSGSNPATYYLYDGATLLAELDPSGTVQTTYGTGAAGLVQRWIPGQNGGVTYGYTFDPSGNVVQRTSTTGLAAGRVADFTTYYDAYGAQLHQIDPNVEYSFQSPDAVGFGGQCGYYTENPTSPPAGPQQMPVVRYPICLLGARYYDPYMGRFLTRDPVGYESGPNVYAYCENNPVMHADPSGLDWLDFAANFSAGWGGALTCGATDWIRGKLGVDSAVDRSSTAYRVGYLVGAVHQTVLINGAAKAILAARAANAGKVGARSVGGIRAWLAARAAAKAAPVVQKSAETEAELLTLIKGVNTGLGGLDNCGTCAVTADALLGGAEGASIIAKGQTGRDVLEAFYGSKFGNLTDLGDLIKEMAAAGDGARGIIAGVRTGGKLGHVVNVINKGGKVYLLDAQTGTTARLLGQGFKGFRLLRTF